MSVSTGCTTTSTGLFTAPASCSVIPCDDCLAAACNTNPVYADFGTSEANFGGDCWTSAGATETDGPIITSDVAGTATVCTDFDMSGSTSFMGFDNCIAYTDVDGSGTANPVGFDISWTIYQEVGGACVALVPTNTNVYGQYEFDNNVTAGTTPGDLGSFDPTIPVTYCYTYTSDGSGGAGNDWVRGNTPVAYGCTSVTAIAAGTQSTCNAADNTYTQDVTVTLSNLPTGGGTTNDQEININGQLFTMTTNPATFTLTGLTADGNSVDVTAFMSVSTGCTTTSTGLFTAPVSCACSAPTGMPMITESACAAGCAPAGGSIAIGNLACATGTLNYSTDGGTTWSATIPTYNQTTAINVMVSCDCDNSLTAGPFATNPGTCTNPADPTGSLMITDSSCGAGCVVSGGTIAIGSVMGTGGTLEYSTDGGSNWGALPAYAGGLTIMASVVDGNGCRSGMVNVGTTTAGTCTNPTFTGTPSCSGGLGTGSISQSASGGVGPYSYAISGGSFGPTLANGNYTVTVTDSNDCEGTALVAVSCAASCPAGLATTMAPQADITESSCTTHGGTPAGGSVNNTTGCPAGSTIEYSVDGGTSWVTDPSALYDQSTAVTVMTRCYCAADGGVASMTNMITTVPGVCPTCSDGVMNGDETGIDCGGATL